MNSTVAIISSLTLFPPDTCSDHQREKTRRAHKAAPAKPQTLEPRQISDLDAELGIVQGDYFHGSDDLSGLLDLSGDDEVKVGLFHQVPHVPLGLHHHRLLHT